MKRLLAALFLILLFLPARAQEIPEVTLPEVRLEVPNEIDLSLSLGTGLQTVGIYGSFFASLIGSLINNDAVIIVPFFIPGLSAGYDRWLNDWFAVGAGVYADVVSAMPYGFVGNFAIMPEVKFRWFNHDNLKLYSRLAAGYSTARYCIKTNDGYKTGSLSTGWMNYLDGIAPERLLTTSSFFWSTIFPPFGLQAVPIGIDINTAVRNLDAFIELGIGTQGIVTFGLKTAF